MHNCRSLGSLWTAFTLMLILAGQVWGLSGSVTDNRIGAGNSTLMVFAMPHQAQIDPYLIGLECASPVTGTYPNYNFDLPCATSGTYDIGIVGWDGSQEESPSFVTDIQTNLPFNATGITLNVQPNTSHISGDLYDQSSFSLITQPAEVWAFDQYNVLAGVAFSDSFGHYDFGYLPSSGAPYILIAKAFGYWQQTTAGINNPAVESFVLGKAFQAQITAVQNSGYNYNYNLHPERINWVLSDAANYDVTLELNSATPGEGALPVDWMMVRLPGGAFSSSKFYAASSSALHTVGSSLDWDAVTVDQSGVQDQISFTQGTGVLVINPQDSADFTIQVASMDNVPNDNYANFEVIVSNNGGNNKASYEAGLAQKILRIADISFYPNEVDTSNQTGPGSFLTVSASVENHGTATFYPYDNWSNIWSPAFMSQGTKVSPASIGAGSFSTLALLDAQVTGVEGNYELNSGLADSNAANSSYISFEESLQVISTGVSDQNQPGTLPKSFALSQNFPNPFNASTRIDYALANSGRVSLEIYNLLGQKVRTLVSEYQAPGYKTVIWDGKNEAGQILASGVYFYRLKTPASSFTRKMALLR